jgi:hypothetical protein
MGPPGLPGEPASSETATADTFLTMTRRAPVRRIAYRWRKPDTPTSLWQKTHAQSVLVEHSRPADRAARDAVARTMAARGSRTTESVRPEPAALVAARSARRRAAGLATQKGERPLWLRRR